MTVPSSIRVAELSVLLFVLSRLPLLRLWVKLVAISDDSSFSVVVYAIVILVEVSVLLLILVLVSVWC